VFACMAVFFFYIGFKVIASKKPFFFSSKVLFAFAAISFSPQIIRPFETLFSTSNLSSLSYLTLLMVIVVLGYFWFQMRGYIAIGISNDSFRNSLHYALNQNNINYEEQLSLIKLTSVDAEIEVSVQSWVGTGQITLKKSKDKYLLPTLVSSINEYFASNSFKLNYTTSIFYIVLGVIMLFFAGYLYYLMPR
jgi:hypothetical protein